MAGIIIAGALCAMPYALAMPIGTTFAGARRQIDFCAPDQ